MKDNWNLIKFFFQNTIIIYILFFVFLRLISCTELKWCLCSAETACLLSLFYIFLQAIIMSAVMNKINPLTVDR